MGRLAFQPRAVPEYEDIAVQVEPSHIDQEVQVEPSAPPLRYSSAIQVSPPPPPAQVSTSVQVDAPELPTHHSVMVQADAPSLPSATALNLGAYALLAENAVSSPAVPASTSSFSKTPMSEDHSSGTHNASQVYFRTIVASIRL